jgi:hypothetical protein
MPEKPPATAGPEAAGMCQNREPVPPVHHFILTNFNIQIPGVTADRRGTPVLTRDWLEHRLDLFETFCLPSVAGQTCQNFEWLVWFDVASREELGSRISRWQRSVRLTPLWYQKSILETIASRVGRGEAIVITTRLDNDDGLHRDHVGLIQGEAGRRPEILSPTYGYSLHYPEGELRLMRDRLSAFISLVDPVTAPPARTVRSAQHRAAASLAPVRDIGTRPLWLRVTHSRNLWNLPGGDPCGPEGVREGFNLGSRVFLR